MKNFAIGADIGGSHISCAAIDLETGILLKESYITVEVDNKASASAILDKWSLALSSTIARIGNNQLAGIGFAMPGPFDYENGIALFTPAVAKFENLFGVNIAEELHKSLGLKGKSEIRFLNDAISFAVGEAWIGNAKNYNRSICLTIGTGFGSAFIEQGIPVVERYDVPKNGYVYHLPFQEGIADEYFSTRWFIKRFEELSGKTASGVKEIAEAASTIGVAKDLFLEFGRNLGQFLAPLIDNFQAESVVIGGNIAGAFSLFETPFKQSLINQNIHIKIHLSELKEDAALIGSARLLDPLLWDQVRSLLSKI